MEGRESQKKRVVQYMKDFGSITSMEAVMDLGIMRLASRIHDLKEDGYNIKSDVETAINRYGEKVHFARYRLG